MIEEFYLYRYKNGLVSNYIKIDIDDIDISIKYSTPFFTDIENIKNDSTYTIKLPITYDNQLFFEFIDRSDSDSNIQYDYIYADYFRDGHIVFVKAQTIILDVTDHYEIQCVFGVNKEQYVGLFKNKLRDFNDNSFIINWNLDNSIYSDPQIEKYNFIDFISVIRKSDIQTIDGIVQPKEDVPAPFFANNAKKMTLHPFVKFETVLNKISDYLGFTKGEFDRMKSKLINTGIILSGKNDNYTYSEDLGSSDNSYSLNYLYLSHTYEDSIFLVNNKDIRLSPSVYRSSSISGTITMDFTVESSHIVGVELWSITEQDSTDTKIGDFITTQGDYDVYISGSISADFELGKLYYIKLRSASGYDPYPYNLKINNASGSHCTIMLSANITESFYAIDQRDGRYNCNANLPDMYYYEFISNLCKLIGCFFGYDQDGSLKPYFLSDIYQNLKNGNIYDWSDNFCRVTNTKYKLDGYAQKNYIKFNNDKDLNSDQKRTIQIFNNTIDLEKDLYTIGFDSPKNKVNKSEIVLYEQSVTKNDNTVTFTNDYKGSDSSNPIVVNNGGVAVAYDINKSISLIENAYYRNFTGNGGENRSEWICSDLSGYLSSYISIGDTLFSMNDNKISQIIKVIGIIDNEDKIIFDTEIFDNETSIVVTNDILLNEWELHQKILNKIIIKECEFNLYILESSNIDFTKPIYVKYLGKYCILLDLQTTKNEVSVANLLLINETL